MTTGLFTLMFILVTVLTGCTSSDSTRNNQNTVKGIDLSHHNHVRNWDDVKADFIYLKATEGTGWTDPKFNNFLKNAKKRNILVGAYHFMTTASSAEDQFYHFKSVAPKGK